MIMLGNLTWGTTDNKPPLDTPVCGFYGEKCPQDTSGKNWNIDLYSTGFRKLESTLLLGILTEDFIL